jgi:hypothetical protein
VNLLAHVDSYCERTDASLWSEPFNALTNLAFIVAGIVLWQQARGARRRETRALAALIVLIGVCSGLFHVFGTMWGMLLDVASIGLFIVAYVHRYLRRNAGWPQRAAGAGVLAFIAADRSIAAWSAHAGDVGLNGSEGYVLPGVLLFVFALCSRRQPGPLRWLLTAALVFTLSLLLRTFDMALCPVWPHGTHLAWHTLNALVLYCAVRGLDDKRPTS